MTKEKLRILRVSTDVYPEVLGGGAIHAHEMSKLQSKMGHHVTLLTSDHDNSDLPESTSRDGYEVRRFREIARPFGNSITPGMVSEIADLASRFDIIHAHSHLYFSSNITAALSRFSDTPFVITNHGLHSQSAPDFVQEIYLRTLGKFTFNSADKVFCYTETDRQRLKERNVSTDISVIHNGIDCDLFSPDAAENPKETLLFVGRFKKSKGVDKLLDSFSELSDEFPSLELTLVGEGPLESTLRSMTDRYGLSQRVNFEGRVDNEKLPKIYAESTLFGLPSTAEGLPRTILESLACGTPVVCSDLPQLQPIVEEVGESVPIDTVDPLVSALRSLLENDRKRKQYAERGRQKVLNKYSWFETVKKTTAEYSELLGHGYK